MNQNNLQNNQNDPMFNLQSTAEQHNNNYLIADSSDISTFYTNHYSHQQPTYNENTTSTLPLGSSPCVPGPQQTIENTTFQLSPFNMNSVNPSQSEILGFDIPGYKIIVIPFPFPLNSFIMNSVNPSQSEIHSFVIPGYKIIVIPFPFPLNSFNMNSVNPSQSEILGFDIPGYEIIVIPFPFPLNSFNMNSNNNNPYQSIILSYDIPGYKVIFMPTQENTYLNNTQFTQFQQ